MPELPKKIGKYEIVSELGRGAMGIVYKGYDPVISRYAAIKTLSNDGVNAEDCDLASRFKVEAQAVGRLNHPGIVGIYEYGEEGDHCFIAMEFVDGCTLSELIDDQVRLSVDETIDLVCKVLDALQFAHSNGVIHRDIKPSNIMRSKTGDIKITDFGIARIDSSSLTRAGMIIGTPGYMSPEQLMGQTIDTRSDIFSCAVMLYELLTGEKAFSGSNYSATVYKVVHTDLVPASKLCPDVPVEMDDILNKGLAKSRDNRYQSADQFAAALRDLSQRKYVSSVTSKDQLDDGTKIDQVDTQLVQTDMVEKTEIYHPGTEMDGTRRIPNADVQNSNRVTSKLMWSSLALVVIIGITIGAYQLLEISNTEKIKVEDKASDTVAVPDDATAKPDSTNVIPVAESKNIAGRTIKDCDACPELVVVPPGNFLQGSALDDSVREAAESPQHDVAIDYFFAVAKYETTLAEFEQFVSDSGYVSKGCTVYDGEWKDGEGSNWASPGFTQTPGEPVACVSWADAKKYVEWLSGKTGQRYRLLTSSEWEYVAREGTQTNRDWGRASDETCAQTNVADLSASSKYPDWKVHDCNDGYIYTSPVTTLKENALGVAGLMGNVFEWVEDCWNENYQGAPDDGSAWVEGECGSRILRGGSWYSQPRYVRPAFQNHFDSDHRASTFGFRVARDLRG